MPRHAKAVPSDSDHTLNSPTGRLEPACRSDTQLDQRKWQSAGRLGRSGWKGDRLLRILHFQTHNHIRVLIYWRVTLVVEKAVPWPTCSFVQQKVTFYGSSMVDNGTAAKGQPLEIPGASRAGIVTKNGLVLFGNDGKTVNWVGLATLLYDLSPSVGSKWYCTYKLRRSDGFPRAAARHSYEAISTK